MYFSEPKAKKLKMEESNDFISNSHLQLQSQQSPRRMATTFHEFMSDPISFTPRPEFIDNFYIDDDTALIAAIKAQNRQAIIALLQAGCSPNLHNKKGVMPISAAAHKGDTSIVELLLKKGAQVDALNFSGSTALIQAAHFGHLTAVVLLLNYGGDADKANSKGTTALMRAAQEGHEEIARVLIQAKANVNRKNHEGMNALMLASQRGHAGVVFELIKNGAVTDEQTSQGSTALMLACKRGHERVVSVLVSMGAEVCMKDCRNRAAKDTAERRHHVNLLPFLDTQYQVSCIQDHVRNERAQLFAIMRKAALVGKLQFSRDVTILDSLITSLKKIQKNGNQDYVFRVEDIINVASEWSSTSSISKHTKSSSATSNMTTTTTTTSSSSITTTNTAVVNTNNTTTTITTKPNTSLSSTDSVLKTTISTSIPPTSISTTSFKSNGVGSFEENTDGPVERIVDGGGILNLCRNITAALTNSMNPPQLSQGMSRRVSGNADWYWPFILMRCMSLPEGVFEMIVEYIPSPRVWKWTLNRLKKRSLISPQTSVVDTSILIDEMLTDLNLFDTPNQKGHLMRICGNPEFRKDLVNKLYIPEVLVESLVRWSDIQSISFRMTELDISFKSTVAKRYMALAITLYRMVRFVNDPTRLLTLPKMLMQPPPTILFSKKDQRIDIYQVPINKFQSLPKSQSTTSSSMLLTSSSSSSTTTTTITSSSFPLQMNVNNTNLQKSNLTNSNLMFQNNNNNSNNNNNNNTMHLLQHSQTSNISIDDLFLDEGVLQQMLCDGMQQSNVDTLDEDDSLNEFGGGLANDHDTETELPADGGTYVGSDDDDDN